MAHRPPPATALRRDSAQTRERLLDAAGRLLAERGPAFTLPDLARAAEVASATVYRHFADVPDVHRAYYHRLVAGLTGDLAAASARTRGLRRFEAVCEAWTACAVRWGRAATHIRSAEGFLERVERGESGTTALYRQLAPVVAELLADGEIPEQDERYAVLMWVTVFDERVMVDLTRTLGWSARRIARELSASLLGALGRQGDAGSRAPRRA
ncbi:TetR/AcrR family transcriptional regulator [Streptomyces sp. A7024]|uniref:TetR/AcrR family transcriptional regulator n=1 Tax=Streptomyces coryli TaxID=1128680 RepID=A0A6G4TUM6_9ACTN|nr:TetR/AcrR family transcriptional regulator [Streptomyces coryli]NGN63584.1 TetR/AcrR family transcriptional regulator [Streptomyces coryli]